MPYDEIPWYPAVGGGGQNNYRIPGSRCLDGSTAPGIKVPAREGDVSLYSSTPTAAQLIHDPITNPNVGGMNQAIGLLVRRMKSYSSAFGTSFTIPPYWTRTSGITQLTAIRTAINQLRFVEGLTQYNFVAPMTSKKSRFGAVLEELRQSLGISGIFTPGVQVQIVGGIQNIIGPSILGAYVRNESPALGQNPTEGLFYPYRPSDVGIIQSAVFSRRRTFASFPMPYWTQNAAPAASGARFLVFPLGNSLYTSNNFVLGVYQSATDDHLLTMTPAFQGFAYNMFGGRGAKQGTIPFAYANIFLALSPTAISNALNFNSRYSSWLLATDNEVADSPPTNSGFQPVSMWLEFTFV